MITDAPAPTAADHLLVVDVGNSATKLGLWSNEDVRATGSVRHDHIMDLPAMIADHWQALPAPKAAVACSVVPRHTPTVRQMVRQQTGEELWIVGDTLPVPIEIDVAQPDSVGSDRLCAAATAYMIEGRACAVADAGTALTIDCVDDDGRFIGGVILPGLRMQAAALASGTASLPEVPIIDRPISVFGQDTPHAIQAGIFYGSLGALRDVVERFAERLGRWPTVFLTGGDAELLGSCSDVVDKIVPNLCLLGVALAYRRAFGVTSPEN